jgi:hypothetical protein
MSWNSRSRLNFAHALNKFTHTHTHIHTHTHTHTEVVTVSFPPLGEVPDLWNSSRKFLGVDQAPLPPSGTGPELGLISQGWCLPSPDETARWVGPLLLGVQAGWTAQTVGSPGWRRTQNTIGGTPPRSVLCPSLLWGSPAACWWLKWLVGWDLAGASKCCGNILTDKKPSNTRRSGELRFYFYASGLRCVPCLSTEQRIHRVFKRQCNSIRLQGMCSPIN